jgi:hypothetical protein
MIVIIPASKLQAILPSGMLTCTERLLVCFTHGEDSVVVMGLVQYCLTMQHRGMVCHDKTLSGWHVPSGAVHTTSAAR